jgi:hypothetical protein
LKHRLTRFTATAHLHVKREAAWWHEARVHAEILVAELEEALRVLEVLPGAGMVYTKAGAIDLRRLYLRRIDCHLYHTFDDHRVIIRALWGARRRHGPRLR